MTELYIGLMSGTSMDGVDGALVDFSADSPVTVAFASQAMPSGLRDQLLALQQSGPDELARAADSANALARVYAEVSKQLLASAGASAASSHRVCAIGAHGQTVRHQPESGYTLQLLNGALLAELTGIDVVCDFRSADIAAGGQGAPLVPAFHEAIFSHPAKRRAIINIGGIANLSLLAPGHGAKGCDSGPGNALMDAWHERYWGSPFDRDGEWASRGRPDAGLLARLLSDPYFSRPAPKSTGRDLFNMDWLRRAIDDRVPDLPSQAGDLPEGEGVDSSISGSSASYGSHFPRPEDIQATLLELTARTISAVAKDFDANEAFVCGGGANNGRLMRRLGELMSPCAVLSTQQLGMDPQSVEAVAFAWLARCRLKKTAGNLPAVTGAHGPRVLGALYAAPSPESD